MDEPIHMRVGALCPRCRTPLVDVQAVAREMHSYVPGPPTVMCPRVIDSVSGKICGFVAFLVEEGESA